MNHDKAETGAIDYNRRDFLKGASFGSIMMLMGGVPLQADDKATAAAAGGDTGFSTEGAPVSCALIGCGLWGREILETLATLPNAPVVAICDTYEPFLRRAKGSAPKAETYTDYHQLLENKAVEAVIVATPTHKHREIVEAVLKAGKHVYCEAPLANTAEEAHAIAQAAKAAGKLNFQSGLQLRADRQKKFLLDFVRSGAVGQPVMARSQWHKKQSWRRTSPNAEFEKASNWRLNRETSPGLIGELGIHQIDLISWFLKAHPASVSGMGSIQHWNDGRDVPDTVQANFEFPGRVNYFYDCTLANSFDSDYDILYGTDAAIMVRGNNQWLFKEVDSPLLGWEIYAKKTQFYTETGIALTADSSKSVTKTPAVENPHAESPLHYALAAFVHNAHLVTTGVKDFNKEYGADTEGVEEYLAGPSVTKARITAPGYQEGLEATLIAIKANESILQSKKIALDKDTFKV